MVWECKYPIVWVPKKRRKIIFGKLRQEIGAILRRLCEYKGVELLEGKACIDHIHLCVSIPPKYAVVSIVGYLKEKSLMIVFEKYSKLKGTLRGTAFGRVGTMSAQWVWMRQRQGNTSKTKKRMNP